MIIILITFLFSAELPLVSSDASSSTLHSEQSLSSCFQNKQQLFRTCLKLTVNDRLAEITKIWTRLNDVYGVVDECDTCSMGYEESRKYELFYALCCLSVRDIPHFLDAFDNFYQTVFIERKKISASFLMVCAILEDDPIKALELLQAVARNCGDTDPLIFVAQFAEKDHGLPRATELMRVEGDEEDFLIAELQRLSATRTTQPDPGE